MTSLMARSLTGAVLRGWQSYLALLDRYPARTVSLNTAVLMTSGDVIAQLLFEKRRPLTGEYDVVRTLRFFGVGLLLAGPAMHVWYSTLDRVVKGRGMSMALRKMFADQGFFMPVYLVVFVAAMGALRGDRAADIGSKLKRDMAPMMKVSYSIWPAVQLANFKFVPSRHRVFVINVVCLFWNTYIGWRAEMALRHVELPDRTVSSDT